MLGNFNPMHINMNNSCSMAMINECMHMNTPNCGCTSCMMRPHINNPEQLFCYIKDYLLFFISNLESFLVKLKQLFNNKYFLSYLRELISQTEKKIYESRITLENIDKSLKSFNNFNSPNNVGINNPGCIYINNPGSICMINQCTMSYPKEPPLSPIFKKYYNLINNLEEHIINILEKLKQSFSYNDFPIDLNELISQLDKKRIYSLTKFLRTDYEIFLYRKQAYIPAFDEFNGGHVEPFLFKLGKIEIENNVVVKKIEKKVSQYLNIKEEIKLKIIGNFYILLEE